MERNRHLNAPSQSHSDRRPQTHRRPADGKQLAGTDLTDIQAVTMVTAGCTLWFLWIVTVVAMGTVWDEGSVCGWQQDEGFFSRNHTVKILIMIFVH